MSTVIINCIDTDSLCVSLVDELDCVVKPTMVDQWKNEKSRWFVTDPGDPKQIRQPGLMKLEWETRNGAIVW